MMVIYKFGGSSVATKAGVLQIKKIINENDEQKIIVISALGKRFESDAKITDLLIELCSLRQKGKQFKKIKEKIVKRFNSWQDLLIKDKINKVKISLLSENLQKFSDDKIISFGEYYTAKIIAKYLNANFIDATKIIIGKNGIPDLDLSQINYKQLSLKKTNVVPGFYFCNDNKIKLLERGGGDVSGSIIANISDASFYYNYTDVNGILTCSYANLYTQNSTIYSLSYGQLLNFFNCNNSPFSKNALCYLAEKNIPLKIANTFNSSGYFTIINNVKSRCIFFYKSNKCAIFTTIKKYPKSRLLYNILQTFTLRITQIFPLFFIGNSAVFLIEQNCENIIIPNVKICEITKIAVYDKITKIQKNELFKLIKNYGLLIKIKRLHPLFSRYEIFIIGKLTENSINKITEILNNKK